MPHERWGLFILILMLILIIIYKCKDRINDYKIYRLYRRPHRNIPSE